MTDKLKLKNGKEISVNGGIIGLSAKPDDPSYEWSPSEGWDSGIPDATYSEYFEKKHLKYDHITKAEMLEICDIMLARWQEFKSYVEEQKEKDYVLNADKPDQSSKRC